MPDWKESEFDSVAHAPKGRAPRPCSGRLTTRTDWLPVKGRGQPDRHSSVELPESTESLDSGPLAWRIVGYADPGHARRCLLGGHQLESLLGRPLSRGLGDLGVAREDQVLGHREVAALIQ